MKTLTRISTTALIGLLAVALSSSVFAGRGGGGGGGQGNFGSINHYNDCSINEDLKALIVVTTISDDSDDTEGVVAELGELSVAAKQKGKGPWQPFLGAATQPADFGDNYTMIPLCGDTPIADTTHTMNADVEIEVLNARGGKSYSGRCDDNPLTDDVDESIVDVPEGICD